MVSWREHIVSFLGTSLEELRTEIAQAGKCCDLKSLDFSGGNTPNYADRMVQNLYILRYYGGYVCEYRTLYEELLPFLNGQPPSVLTVGAGCCPDLSGLYFASGGSEGIKYRGYDIVPWRKTAYFPNVDAAVRVGCASEPEEEDLSFNMLVFAKSLSDIGPDAFGRLCELFERTPLTHARFVVAGSGKPTDPGLEKTRFCQITDIIRKKGYNTDDVCSAVWGFNDKVAWSKVYPGFTVPPEVVEYIKALAEQCPTRQARGGTRCDGKTDCDSVLSRWPILKREKVTLYWARFVR